MPAVPSSLSGTGRGARPRCGVACVLLLSHLSGSGVRAGLAAGGTRSRDVLPHETPARTGTFTAPTSWCSVSGGSPGGAHQHEAQAQAVAIVAFSATAGDSVAGLRLIANAAMA